jgi:ribosomal protein S18 acetylase RimI-like enzyme
VTTVRRATPDDARAIAEVHVETWRAAYVGVIPQETLDSLDVGERQRIWERYATAEGSAVFVAEREARIVGFVSVGSCRELDGTGELFAIYSHPDAWDTGAGRALMDAAVAWLAEHWPEAVLWVAEQNPRARRFYERYGWIAQSSRVEEVAPGAHVPEVLYRLSGLDRR